MDMEISCSADISDSGVPYREMLINGFGNQNIDVTIRRYPRNTYIAYEDERCNAAVGPDYEDLWTAPTIVFRTVRNGADIRPVIQDLAAHLKCHSDTAAIWQAWNKLPATV